VSKNLAYALFHTVQRVTATQQLVELEGDPSPGSEAAASLVGYALRPERALRDQLTGQTLSRRSLEPTTFSLRGRTTPSHPLSTSASSNTAATSEREIPHAYPSFRATSHAMHHDHPRPRLTPGRAWHRGRRPSDP
jgi:hypothetical protein